MKIFEFDNQQDASTGYYNPAEDKAHTAELSQTRRARLTLKHLGKLKRMRALKRLENMKRQDLLSVMYAPPADDGMGGGFGGPGGF